MIKRRNKRAILLPVLVASLLLTAFGCGKKDQPVPAQPMPKPVIKPAAPVQTQASSAKTATPPHVLLDFTNKKDPFKPVIAAQPVKEQSKPTPAVRKGEVLPIQSYEVNKFRVAGIIAGLKENTALIIDPAGRGYVVREGMMIGSNDGRISRITPKALEVIEQYRDDNGHLRKRTIILSLAKKQ
jgi:type IV pilus assembly protein PilP